MMDGMNAATGQCLCGTITFRISGELRDVYNCHCNRCRRFTGHHMAATAADTGDLIVEDEGSNLRWYYAVPEAAYGFCARCGSSLFWRSPGRPSTVSICAGAIDPTHAPTDDPSLVDQRGQRLSHSARSAGTRDRMRIP